MLLSFSPLRLSAQSFDRWFDGRTLRLDYLLSGNASEQHIALSALSSQPRWWGRRAHLDSLPLEGNGQLTLRDHRTQKVLYRQSFSTLFQEWQQTDEARSVDRAFEHVVLAPMPRDTVEVTLELRNNRRQVTATLHHTVVPTDILIRPMGRRGITPYVTLQQAADTAHCIHLAFVAEGYQRSQMNTFLSDARKAMEALFAHEPFRLLRHRFQVVAVQTASEDEGVSEPSENHWKNTAFGAHFDTFYSKRYLTTARLFALHDCLAGVPYEHILVLANTARYGGGGILNSYVLSTTHHPSFLPVVVHEFGHSFGGLADEYAYEDEVIPMYPHDVEPWEPNITTRVNFHHKWENLLSSGAGFYEGAGYSLHGVYRAYEDCRMRTNDTPEFCPACQQALTRLIHFYTDKERP